MLVLFLLAASIILNYHMMRREVLRRESEHEKRQERFEKLFFILQMQNSDKNGQVSDARDDDKNSKS